MTKFALSLVAVAALAWTSGCDGGSSDGGGGNGGDASSSGGSGSGSGGRKGSGGGSTSGGGSNLGGGDNTGGTGAGTGGGAQNSDVTAFCAKFGTDCSFSTTDAERFMSSSACITEAGAIAEENAPRFECMEKHLGYVTAMGASHCSHAKGAAPCSETEFPE